MVRARCRGTEVSTSMESWLDCNRRAIGLGTAVPLAFVGLGAYFLARSWPAASMQMWVYRLFGGLLLLVGGGILVALWRAYRRPRIACDGGQVLFYLRGSKPIAVPLDAVECFFAGQGPSHLGTGAMEVAETANVVVRLAERATDWQQVDVKPAFGRWCGGYITIHGAWCEPINVATLTSLNARLGAAKRALRNPSS